MTSSTLAYVLILSIIGPSLSFQRHQQREPNPRDYEAKVMIFHDNQPPLGSWNPQHGQPYPKPLGHRATKQDIVDNISKGLLRRKLTPTEIENQIKTVNEAGLNTIHEQNKFRAIQKQSAHKLLEEMRHAKAEERKKQHEAEKQLKKRQRQPQLRHPPQQKYQAQSKYQPLSQYQPKNQAQSKYQPKNQAQSKYQPKNQPQSKYQSKNQAQLKYQPRAQYKPQSKYQPQPKYKPQPRNQPQQRQKQTQQQQKSRPIRPNGGNRG